MFVSKNSVLGPGSLVVCQNPLVPMPLLIVSGFADGRVSVEEKGGCTELKFANTTRHWSCRWELRLNLKSELS